MSSIFQEVFTLCIVFVLGTAVGSFLNVVLYRYQTGLTVGRDRSRCMSCGKTLKPSMLVPILSFLIQGGRCAYCKTKLSLQYPLVELASGLLGIMVVLPYLVGERHFSMEISTLITALDFSFFLTLLATTVYDLKHKIIPDRFVLVLLLIAILRIGVFVFLSDIHLIPHIIAATGNSLLFALLWFLSGGRWMGFGDAKLAFPLGLFLGYPTSASLFVLAFWLGTVPALVLLVFQKGITMKSEIPFAPFLALAAVVLYVYPIDILQLQTIWPNVLP